MKNQRLLVLFSLLPLFFACEKENALVEPPAEVALRYWIDVTGEAQLDEVRFLDENGLLQSIFNPPADWQYETTVEQGFVAKMELLGHLPAGENRVYLRFNGSGYSSWGITEYTAVPGEFHLVEEYQMGGN